MAQNKSPIKPPPYLSNAHGTTFHVIPDSVIILAKAGVYKQSSAYIRGRNIYAKHGGGFVQISRHGTSVPNLRVDAFDVPGVPHTFESTGRMIVRPEFFDELKGPPGETVIGQDPRAAENMRIAQLPKAED